MLPLKMRLLYSNWKKEQAILFFLEAASHFPGAFSKEEKQEINE